MSEDKMVFGSSGVTYGVGTRLSKGPSPELVEYFTRVFLDDFDEHAFADSMWINISHDVMLVEAGIVSQDTAAQLLRVFLELDDRGMAAIDFDPVIGDSLPNIESYVTGRLGSRVGGAMHTGRSRGDYYTALTRLKFRRALLGLLGAISDLRSTLLGIASKHVESVMPGYTHMQHAQPITLAHYVMAAVNSLERDFDRAREAFPRVNLSPLGLGIISGTSYPLDRERLAELLGFNGLVLNSRDMNNRDYLLEILSCATIAMMNVHRICTDLYEWTTAEFGMVRVDDSDAMTSSMMPQKANPVLLEEFRARVSATIGALTGAFTTLKGSPANNIEISMSDGPALDALRDVRQALSTFAAFVPRIELRTSRMRELSELHWAQATDVADGLVREVGISFREAHRVVGHLVSDSLDRGMRPLEIGIQELQAAVSAVLDESVDVSQVDIKDWLSAESAVRRRNVPGSPAPQWVNEAISTSISRLADDKSYLCNLTDAIAQARQHAISAARTIAEG